MPEATTIVLPFEMRFQATPRVEFNILKSAFTPLTRHATHLSISLSPPTTNDLALSQSSISASRKLINTGRLRLSRFPEPLRDLSCDASDDDYHADGRICLCLISTY